MRVVVRYGEIMNARRLLPIESGGHFSASDPIPGVGIRLEMLEELAGAGLRTAYPFTLDPRGPLDLEPFALTEEQRGEFALLLADHARYHNLMLSLGLRGDDAYTCTPYLPEVGNRPNRGAVVAWSESSCVIFANSVLGARTNRNAVVVDLLSNLVGFTPEFGLVTDEGRQATWLVEIGASRLPDPQILGAFIARHVVHEVPYVVGLDTYFGTALDRTAEDYLKEMGAACAAVGGAVGLMHVEGLTPEAREMGRDLLRATARSLVVTDADLQALRDSYRVLWRGSGGRPVRCLIGCPQLSLAELERWTEAIEERLREGHCQTVALDTVLSAAPSVLARFAASPAAERLAGMGVKVSPACFEGFMDNPLCAAEHIITNSNKLRAYTTARLLSNGEILDCIAGADGGKAEQDG
jgi:predicted aconitase